MLLLLSVVGNHKDKLAAPKNQAAWLTKPGTPLQVSAAPLPKPSPSELVVKNAAVAINPLDSHVQDIGVFIQQWPAIFGCDVAGEVYEVGADVQRFNKGDRVIGGHPQDGAYALYTVVPANKAAILPDAISFTDGVVVPFAVETAVCVLSLKEPGVAIPGVFTPALGLPAVLGQNSHRVRRLVFRRLHDDPASDGSWTAAGIHISIVGAHNFDFSRRCGAAQVFDHKDPSLVNKIIEAVGTSGHEFIGIFDAIATPNTYAHDLEILAKLGGGHLACVHPPPADVPANVKAGMIFAVNDIATPVWKDYVTPALEAGKIQCLPPPTVVGKGLEYIQEALKKSKAGVSATKLVVEL
ncbi:Dehydrogenase orsE [Lachnellula arida]|uniref:Dehydrogenase orsE n=1 Tax=Lachnellula arida TaxID=1316785 RepID=A0A8T9B711_9HELO|nr:Dehydrogenase orsE [Lachnellula arida]